MFIRHQRNSSYPESISTKMFTLPVEQVPRGTLSRRSSGRPSSLQIQYSSGEWTPDLVLDSSPSQPLINDPLMSIIDHVGSDDLLKAPTNKSPPEEGCVSDDYLSQPLNTNPLMFSVGSGDLPKNPTSDLSPEESHISRQLRSLKQPLKSPCFVHSLLDKGVSFQDWLYHTRIYNSIGVPRSLGNAVGEQFHLKRPHTLPTPQPVQESPPSSLDDEEDDDPEGTGSLTRQLAETAVGVREMSKQLGMST